MALLAVIFVFVVAAFSSTFPSTKSVVEAAPSTQWTKRFEEELTTVFEEVFTDELLPSKLLSTTETMKMFGIDPTNQDVKFKFKKTKLNF